MSRRGLTSRDRRALLIGAVVIGGSIALVKGLPALRRWDESSADRLAAARVALELESHLATATDAYRSARSSIDSISALGRPNSFRASSAAIATSQLMARIASLAQFSGAQLLSTAPRGDTLFVDGIAVVGLRAALLVDAAALAELLARIEDGPEAIAIVALTATQPDVAAIDPKVSPLRVELSVDALAIEAPNEDLPARKVANAH